MSIPGSASPLFLATAAAAAAAPAAHQIDRSLRFNDDDTANLSRTPSSASNRKTWTWSAWVKRSGVGIESNLFTVGSSSTEAAFRFNANDTLQVRDGGGGELQTDAKFRDPFAWYHIVVALDNTKSTNTDRFKLYVNGVEQTYSSASYAAQNTDSDFNKTTPHYIGRQAHNTSHTLDGYLTEVHWVDGRQLAATDFGETRSSDGVWVPKEFTDHNSFINSQTFSNNITTTGNGGNWSTIAGIAKDKAFNNDDSNYAHANANGSAAAVVTLTLSPAIAATGSVSFRGGLTSGGGGTISINGGTATNLTTCAAVDPAATDITTVSFSGNVSTITITKTATGGQGLIVYGFEIDGKRLVDNGVSVTSNSFYLKFADNSSTSNLGTDSSGNSNTWSVNNFSVASGKANDSMVDTPTNYTADSGNNGGNYATLNSISPVGRDCAFSNGNLDVVVGDGFGNTNNDGIRAVSTIGMTSGKWYFEHEITGGSVARSNVGVVNDIHTYGFNDNHWVGRGSGDYIVWSHNGKAYNGGSETNYGVSWTTGDIIGCAFDADNGNLYVYKNGTVMNSGTAAHTGLTSGPYFFVCTERLSSISANFGQRPFAHTPPTGYVSLCTENLSQSAYASIPDGSTAMNVKTWSGNSTERAITGYNFKPEFVWIKTINGSDEHVWSDSVRGAGKVLSSSANNGESDFSDPGHWGSVKSFDSDGFTVQSGAGGYHRVNLSGRTYVGWAWDAGTSNAASNTDGSITTNVKASQANGFSIVSYTGNGTSGATVGHGLSAAPEWVVCKDRDDGDKWQIYHAGAQTSGAKQLRFTTDIATDNNGVWNNTAPTNSVVTLGGGGTNDNGNGHIMYCWAPVEGYSAFGSYKGNGASGYPDADGPFVFTGMRPRYVLIKATSQTEHWVVYDTARSTYNVLDDQLYPNVTTAQTSGDNREIDVLSNGFKIRSNSGQLNSNNATYIWAAFAEHPFKTARAR